MKRKINKFLMISMLIVTLVIPLSGCQETQSVIEPTPQQLTREALEELSQSPTEIPVRSTFSPGQLVDYTVQTGDSVPALAIHFNTTEREIMEANPIIPDDVTTLPPGMPMKIPIYYQALWGSPYQIIPDGYFVYGPAELDFDPVEYVASQPGWLHDFVDYPSGDRKIGGEIIEHVARNYSVSPRLLLAILEYQTGALTKPEFPGNDKDFMLGFHERDHESLSQQLVLVANTLNNGYYGWRTGRLTSFEHIDGRLEKPDPWQNSASVAIQYYYSRLFSKAAYEKVTHENGLIKTYRELFGFDPWQNDKPHIPGSLVQPEMQLPYEGGKTWNLTGGPHTGWGEGDPWAAIDFAPLGVANCSPSNDWVTAVADGVISRTATAFAVLDLDGDGHEETGWSVIYLHIKTSSLVPLGSVLKAGDPIGYPSCEGGSSTGTHVHIARKYNGEWIPAGEVVPFNLEGWIAQNGSTPYDGAMVRFGKVAEASTLSEAESIVQAKIR